MHVFLDKTQISRFREIISKLDYIFSYGRLKIDGRILSPTNATRNI